MGRALPLIAIALLSGCNMAAWIWGRLDSTIVERADHWLDLSPEQEHALAGRLQPWLDDARREALPRYASFLNGLADRAGDGLGPAEVAWATSQGVTLYRDSVASAIGWIAPTLADLDAAQQRHLADRIRERNADDRDRQRSGTGDRSELAERIIEHVERWTGTLDREQRELVHRRVAALPRTSPEGLVRRNRMQARLLATIRQAASADRIAAHLEQWWIEIPVHQSGRAETRARMKRIGKLAVDLSDTLTPRQHARATDRMRDLAEQLEALAGAGT